MMCGEEVPIQRMRVHLQYCKREGIMWCNYLIKLHDVNLCMYRYS